MYGLVPPVAIAVSVSVFPLLMLFELGDIETTKGELPLLIVVDAVVLVDVVLVVLDIEVVVLVEVDVDVVGVVVDEDIVEVVELVVVELVVVDDAGTLTTTVLVGSTSQLPGLRAQFVDGLYGLAPPWVSQNFTLTTSVPMLFVPAVNVTLLVCKTVGPVL